MAWAEYQLHLQCRRKSTLQQLARQLPDFIHTPFQDRQAYQQAPHLHLQVAQLLQGMLDKAHFWEGQAALFILQWTPVKWERYNVHFVLV